MKKLIISGIASLELVMGGSSAVMAETMHSPQTAQEGQFHRIEQPFANKAIVTLGGLGLIGLELWWFLLSKPRPRKATTK
ncbi:hypothetical protein [Leptolyngbya sp. FACHB-17]|uniref:hypothetical protein n=1 Tax=unclassified Leptolyngbya TaxID=2650499 RepID=UPI0018F02DF7|nr:hypothetical protein [Leptolyngbya sp. FACHB-17]